MKQVGIWSTVVDYFLMLGAIIGVGFASGKEIYVFFFEFGAMSLLGLLAFGLLYVYLFFVLQHIKNKLKLNSYNEFNGLVFGKMCKLTNIFLILNFAITSAGMLAGADYMFCTFFGLKIKIVSYILSILTFVLLLTGMKGIKFVANLIVPIMLVTIVINSIRNITPQNVNLNIVNQNGLLAVFYGLLFGVNNFIAALPILFETKFKSKGKLFVILSICFVILLNILVLASNHFKTDMPMLEVSANVSSLFYYIYFATMIFALFSTLMVCSFNMYHILVNGRRSVFLASIVVIINAIISNFGYPFIVKYLYVVSGIISGIYVVVLLIAIFVQLIKSKIKSKNNDKNT